MKVYYAVECDNSDFGFWIKDVQCATTGDKTTSIIDCSRSNFGITDGCGTSSCIRLICDNEEDIIDGKLRIIGTSENI